MKINWKRINLYSEAEDPVPEEELILVKFDEPDVDPFVHKVKMYREQGDVARFVTPGGSTLDFVPTHWAPVPDGE